MEQVATSAAFYIGTYVTTKYVFNYVASKATEKVIEGSWALSKKAANAAIDHLVKHPEELPIDYLEYELLEIDPEDKTIIRVVNVIEMPPDCESMGDIKLK